MTKTIFIYCFTSLLTISAFGQTNIDQLFSKADSSYFDYKDYETALDLYEQIRNQIDSSHKDYIYTIDKIARALFYLEMEAREKNDVEKSIELSKEFVNHADNYPKRIDPAVLEKKYFMYKNIIIGYFALGQKDKAKPYQDKLYTAYENKELPEGIDEYYNFEKFNWNGLNVWGYERYPQLDDPKTEGSFSKHVYYIYSTDEEGNDKDQLYTLQTVKIHKFKGDEHDYVLTKREYLDGGEKSESIWTYTFNDPVDYEKLHNAVVEYLKGNVESDTESEVEYGKGAKIKMKK